MLPPFLLITIACHICAACFCWLKRDARPLECRQANDSQHQTRGKHDQSQSDYRSLGDMFAQEERGPDRGESGNEERDRHGAAHAFFRDQAIKHRVSDPCAKGAE